MNKITPRSRQWPKPVPVLTAEQQAVRRVLRPDGLFSVVIPREGGLAYALARNISARRIFEKRYKQSYDWFPACEHLNLPNEILEELDNHFSIAPRAFFPLMILSIKLHLVIGLTLTQKGMLT